MSSETLYSTISPFIAQAAEPGAGGGGSMMLLVYGLLFAGMYFLIIAPQRKKQKQHEALVKTLKQGDKVLTSGGIYGTISSVKNDRFMVRIAENTKIEVAKHAIGTIVAKEAAEEEESTEEKQ